MPGVDKKKAIVVGGGVAATAIADSLIKKGLAVELVFPTYGEGSSYTNQKWQHSGLLYPEKAMAKKAWDAYGSGEFDDYIVSSPSLATFFALQAKTITKRKRDWAEWDIENWGINTKIMSEAELSELGKFSGASPVGGFKVPDRIIDFPGLIYSKHKEIKDRRHKVTAGANVKKVLFDDSNSRVSKVEIVSGNKITQKEYDLCVLAAGAWSKQIIEESGLSWPNLILRKCTVLIYEGELVPNITTCLDIKNDLGEDDVTHLNGAVNAYTAPG